MALALGVILIGKPAAALIIVLLMRYPIGVALAVAVALAQIGEFSFMLATVGRDLKVLDPGGTNALVAAAIISISVNPLLYRAVDPIAARVRRASAGGDTPAVAAPDRGDRPSDTRHRAIVVGYGPSGQSVTRLLRENGIAPTSSSSISTSFGSCETMESTRYTAMPAVATPWSRRASGAAVTWSSPQRRCRAARRSSGSRVS